MKIRIFRQGEGVCIEDIDFEGNIHTSVIADSLMKAIKAYDKVHIRKIK